jgi:hypothetical protein
MLLPLTEIESALLCRWLYLRRGVLRFQFAHARKAVLRPSVFYLPLRFLAAWLAPD